jgi:ornithine carbamoyltransferase
VADVRHFLDLWRLDGATLRALLDEAARRKAARAGWPTGKVDADAPADGRTLAMIFEKNSTRTRFSFDAAIRQLGGSSVIANAQDMQLGRGEPVEDTARVLSRMVDLVMIRANRHEDVERFAQASGVPDRPRPPLPDPGGPDDLRSAQGSGGGQDPGLDWRRQ